MSTRGPAFLLLLSACAAPPPDVSPPPPPARTCLVWDKGPVLVSPWGSWQRGLADITPTQAGWFGAWRTKEGGSMVGMRRLAMTLAPDDEERYAADPMVPLTAVRTASSPDQVWLAWSTEDGAAGLRVVSPDGTRLEPPQELGRPDDTSKALLTDLRTVEGGAVALGLRDGGRAWSLWTVVDGKETRLHAPAMEGETLGSPALAVREDGVMWAVGEVKTEGSIVRAIPLDGSADLNLGPMDAGASVDAAGSASGLVVATVHEGVARLRRPGEDGTPVDLPLALPAGELSLAVAKDRAVVVGDGPVVQVTPRDGPPCDPTQGSPLGDLSGRHARVVLRPAVGSVEGLVFWEGPVDGASPGVWARRFVLDAAEE